MRRNVKNFMIILLLSPHQQLLHHMVQWWWSEYFRININLTFARPNMFPALRILLTAAILAMTGRLWTTKLTLFFWALAMLIAELSRPWPETWVAAWAECLDISLAAPKKMCPLLQLIHNSLFVNTYLCKTISEGPEIKKITFYFVQSN